MIIDELYGKGKHSWVNIKECSHCGESHNYLKKHIDDIHDGVVYSFCVCPKTHKIIDLKQLDGDELPEGYYDGIPYICSECGEVIKEEYGLCEDCEKCIDTLGLTKKQKEYILDALKRYKECDRSSEDFILIREEVDGFVNLLCRSNNSSKKYEKVVRLIRDIRFSGYAKLEDLKIKFDSLRGLLFGLQDK